MAACTRRAAHPASMHHACPRPLRMHAPANPTATAVVHIPPTSSSVALQETGGPPCTCDGGSRCTAWVLRITRNCLCSACPSCKPPPGLQVVLPPCAAPCKLPTLLPALTPALNSFSVGCTVNSSLPAQLIQSHSLQPQPLPICHPATPAHSPPAPCRPPQSPAAASRRSRGTHPPSVLCTCASPRPQSLQGRAGSAAAFLQGCQVLHNESRTSGRPCPAPHRPAPPRRTPPRPAPPKMLCDGSAAAQPTVDCVHRLGLVVATGEVHMLHGQRQGPWHGSHQLAGRAGQGRRPGSRTSHSPFGRQQLSSAAAASRLPSAGMPSQAHLCPSQPCLACGYKHLSASSESMISTLQLPRSTKSPAQCAGGELQALGCWLQTGCWQVQHTNSWRGQHCAPGEMEVAACCCVRRSMLQLGNTAAATHR